MTNSQFQILKTEVTTDPLGRGYAGMTEDVVIASLLTSDRPARQIVDIWQVKKLLLEAGEWPMLVLAQTNENAQLAGAALSAVAYINDQRFEHLDMDLPAVQTMIGALRDAGIISQATYNSVDALATTTQTRAAELGITEIIRIRDVRNARL